MLCPNCGKEAGQEATYCPQCGTRIINPTPSGGKPSTSTRSMRGRVLAFDWKAGTGVVSGDDGNRYQFTGQEWCLQDQPQTGAMVDFLPDGPHARDLYLCNPPSLGANPTWSRRFIAGLLAVLVGWLGFHKFYLGYNQQGVIQLIGGTVGWILIIPGMIAWIVGIIEGVTYLTKTDEEFDRIYVQGRREWF